MKVTKFKLMLELRGINIYSVGFLFDKLDNEAAGLSHSIFNITPLLIYQCLPNPYAAVLSKQKCGSLSSNLCCFFLLFAFTEEYSDVQTCTFIV